MSRGSLILTNPASIFSKLTHPSVKRRSRPLLRSLSFEIPIHFVKLDIYVPSTLVSEALTFFLFFSRVVLSCFRSSNEEPKRKKIKTKQRYSLLDSRAVTARQAMGFPHRCPRNRKDVQVRRGSWPRACYRTARIYAFRSLRTPATRRVLVQFSSLPNRCDVRRDRLRAKTFAGIPPELFYYARAPCPLHYLGVRT